MQFVEVKFLVPNHSRKNVVLLLYFLLARLLRSAQMRQHRLHHLTEIFEALVTKSAVTVRGGPYPAFPNKWILSQKLFGLYLRLFAKFQQCFKRNLLISFQL